MNKEKDERPFSKASIRAYLKDVLIIEAVAVGLTIVVGLFLHWRTLYQFAEGLTWAGALVLVAGASGPLGFWRQTRSLPYQYASTRTDVELYDRIRNDSQEAVISYRYMYLFFFAGSLLLLAAISIHKLIR